MVQFSPLVAAVAAGTALPHLYVVSVPGAAGGLVSDQNF